MKTEAVSLQGTASVDCRSVIVLTVSVVDLCVRMVNRQHNIGAAVVMLFLFFFFGIVVAGQDRIHFFAAFSNSYRFFPEILG